MAGRTELFAVINGVSVTQGQRAIVNESEESHLCQIAVAMLNTTQ